MKSWKTVELFCGIGGFRLAADALKIETVWANEIDDKAAFIYTKRFGDMNFHHGDIRECSQDIPEHDILTAGFPCQPFSSAGKKLGICDPRGTLFSEIVEILRQRKPSFFILENVKRLLSMNSGIHFATILYALTQAGYCVEWRVLNAMWFGLPQHRERIILIGRKSHNLQSYFYSSQLYSSKQDENLNHIRKIQLECSQLHKIQEHRSKFQNWGLAWEDSVIDQHIEIPVCQANPNIRLHHLLEKNPASDFFFTKDTLERIKNSEEVNRYFNGVEILYNQKGGARMGYSIFGIHGVSPTLTSTTSRHYERYKVGEEYRRLTNIEYARLQGFPDSHCDGISPYHQYTLLGNAVPPNLIQWVMSRLINDQFLPVEIEQARSSKQLELSLL